MMSDDEARSLDLTVAGAILLPPDTEGQPPPDMLVYNGSAILFSGAPGVVESVKGQRPGTNAHALGQHRGDPRSLGSVYWAEPRWRCANRGKKTRRRTASYTSQRRRHC